MSKILGQGASDIENVEVRSVSCRTFRVKARQISKNLGQGASDVKKWVKERQMSNIVKYQKIGSRSVRCRKGATLPAPTSPVSCGKQCPGTFLIYLSIRCILGDIRL